MAHPPRRRPIVRVAIAFPVILLAPADGAPRPLPINTRWTEKDPWLCPDGRTVLFASDRGGGGFDLWRTRWDGRTWSEPARLGPWINTPFDEWAPSVSEDGRRLLFLSHRERFHRGPWLAPRLPDGAWGRPSCVPTLQEVVREARIGPDGRSVFFRGKHRGTRTLLRVDRDPRTGVWSRPAPSGEGLPPPSIRRAGLHVFARDGDLWFEAPPPPTHIAADRRETLIAVAASSVLGPGDVLWASEPQNLLDGLEDTGWASKPGAGAAGQWVLIALAGPALHEPGESEIRLLRIHAGPVDLTGLEGVQAPGPGTQPARLRILGGLDPRDLRELTVADMERARERPGGPWCRIPLAPARVRYLRIEIAAARDPAAPFVGFNEIEAYGTGGSVPRVRHRVARDEAGNIAIDGRPFFPLYLYNVRQGDLAALARWGFNTALLTYSMTSDTARLALLDDADRCGLKVIAWIPVPDDPAARRMARNMVLAARDHPALLGYLMSDESGGDEEVMRADERRAALIHRHDPDRFTCLNDLYPANYPRSARIVDVFSIDPYPAILGKPPAYQADAVEAAQEACGRRKPVIVVNAAWHGPGGRLVSPAMNRLLAYLALIHGAKGLAWYALRFGDAGEPRSAVWDDPAFWGSVLRCVAEVRRLEPVLFAPEPPADSPLWRGSAIDNPVARIDVSLKAVGEEVWLLAANPEARSARPRFAFGWADAIDVEEVLAERPAAWRMARGGPAEIAFPSYGVRVFRLRPSGPIGPRFPPNLPDGRPLARTNRSALERTRERIATLRREGKTTEASNLVEAFRARYGDRVPEALLEALGAE